MAIVHETIHTTEGMVNKMPGKVIKDIISVTMCSF